MPSFPSNLLCLTTALLLLCSSLSAAEPCRIEIVEKGTGWPVPLVELRTSHNVRLVSDNAGVIAMDLPELMNRSAWFDVIGNGYEVPKDAFGAQGVRLEPAPGKTFKIEVERKIIAKRLGRATGGGLFAESQQTGRALDWPESPVFGCDSVQNAVHRGKLYWAWGDTLVPSYFMGVFDVTSATSAIQPLEAFEPPLRLKLDQFTDAEGKPRGVMDMPGDGPTWPGGYVSLPDKDGKPHLVSSYMKIRDLMEVYETGLCVWNDEKSTFERERVLWTKKEWFQTPPPAPGGHPAFFKDEEDREWVLFGNPLPTLRCPANFESWKDPKTWEVLKPQESFVSATGGQSIKPHSGSIAHNKFRKRWVTVFLQAGGSPSPLGEIWYAEADAPTGPWGKAVKILSHKNYTFYNPRLHPEFTPPDSPILFFEGTYTMQFTNTPPTPRYDYNQIIYRLDLDDPRLKSAAESVAPKH